MKEPKAWVLQVLEWGPLLLFFGVFMLNRGGDVALWGQSYTPLVFATLVFIPALALATLVRWRLTGKLAPMQIATLVLVVVFGGVGSLWGTLTAAMSLGVVNKFLEPYAGAVLAKVFVLVLVILFIQKKPRGLFAQKGRAVEA